jgi:cytidine deaminase
MPDQPIRFSDLSGDEQRAIDAAWAVTKHSYCPYTNFRVGSAVVTEDGTVFAGCNIENAGMTPAICSERVAASKAVSEGHRRFRYVAIVCATKLGGWSCGVCRQFLCEFGLDVEILTVIDENNSVLKRKLSDLLPESFGPHSL